MADKVILNKFIDLLKQRISPDCAAYPAYEAIIKVKASNFTDLSEYGRGVGIVEDVLTQRQPDISDLLVCSLYAYTWDNVELAKLLFSFAYHRDETLKPYLTWFQISPIYLGSTIGKTIYEVAEMYISMGMAQFYTGNLYKADMCIQRSHALMKPFGGQADDFVPCLERMQEFMANGTESLLFDERRKARDKKWVGETEKEGIEHRDNWLKDDNKIFLSEIVASMEPTSIIELGSHAGALASMIFHQCKVEKYIGVEPDSEVARLCKETYPFIDIIEGNHNDLPDIDTDILLLSCVLLLLDPGDVDIIFEWASEHAKQVVIMDDTVNIWGKFPVIRRYYVLHPYQQLFDKYNFELFQRVYPPYPNLGITGILIANNRGRV